MGKNTKYSDRTDATDIAFCTCATLRKAARVVTRAYDAALKPAGVKPTQFNLLATLARRGDLPLTKLADALVMDRTTLTRNLKPIAAKGWIFIGQEDDQRIRQIGLTDKGRHVFKTALPHWKKVQARIVGDLGITRWSQILLGLTETVSAVQAR
jgi:DNA-binding MarR family transcriptional regulator